ncbi:folate-binding protein [Marinobacter sp. CHS3-4]|uniref:CAF17-like 4Fe-4S cluster assembly/insertion protein YgfZ n=1 Tax=Marinobacter sp. CHS3-4 TaxID=3045174 RepID=UPI0024B5C8C4|nr:folate-binding protein [Marinobacter sp. CHS3-4]MDI9246132.1 folate-binding protein [Marinobacter sp. CHS3-4]
MSESGAAVAQFPLPSPARIMADDQIIFRISGPGTDKFLQGQFSQQVEDATEQFSPRASACTPKGRAYCLTRMVRDGSDILIALPEALVEETVTHLRKYLMLFRGTSMEAESDARLIGLLGAESANALLSGAAEQLSFPSDSARISGGHLIRTMDTAEGLARFEFWQTEELPADAHDALARIPEHSRATWQASEIAAGVPGLTPDTRESFVPQMLNWQHLGGVHFKKGCYTGQEVIARMHFLGQLKKSLFRFSCPAGTETPEVGMALKNEGRSVGEIVNAIGLSDGSSQCLAVVRHDAAEESLVTDAAPETPLTLLPLPYRVSEREPAETSDT